MREKAPLSVVRGSVTLGRLTAQLLCGGCDLGRQVRGGAPRSDSLVRPPDVVLGLGASPCAAVMALGCGLGPRHLMANDTLLGATRCPKATSQPPALPTPRHLQQRLDMVGGYAALIPGRMVVLGLAPYGEIRRHLLGFLRRTRNGSRPLE